jgi:hypothetical protein
MHRRVNPYMQRGEMRLTRCFASGLGVDTCRGRAWSLASGHKRPVATDKRLVCVAFGRCSLSGSGLVVEEMRWG